MTEQVPSPSKPPGAIRRLQSAQLRLAATALVTMMLGTVLDVFFRYVFNKPLRISYDLVESMLVIYVFHGISSVFLARRNIVIDVINSLVSPAILRALAAIADLVSVMCLLLLAGGHVGACDAGLPVWRPQTRTGRAALCAVGIRADGTARHAGLRDGRLHPHHPAPVAETTVSPAIIGALGILSLLILLFVRVPVWAALTLVGFTGNYILSGLHSALSLSGTARVRCVVRLHALGHSAVRSARRSSVEYPAFGGSVHRGALASVRRSRRPRDRDASRPPPASAPSADRRSSPPRR